MLIGSKEKNKMAWIIETLKNKSKNIFVWASMKSGKGVKQ